MEESGSAPWPTARRQAWEIYLLLILCVIAVHVAVTAALFPGVLNGDQIDPDGYARLLRVSRLWETRRWFDDLLPSMNAPFGLTFHWTRPLDLILLAGTLPLTPFLGFQKALQVTGALVSPLLHIGTLLAAVWAMAPVLPVRHRPLVILALLAQPILVSYGLAGRADHHMLLFLSYVLALGCFLRSVSSPLEPRWAFSCGLLAGFGLWVSVESLLPTATLLASFGLLWTLGFPETAGKGFRFSLGVLVIVVVGLFLEHSPGALLTVEYDRVSIPHVVAAGLGAVAWGLLTLIPEAGENGGSRLKRGAQVFLVGVVGLGLAWSLFPGLLANPLSAGDPAFWATFGRQFAEIQPLWPQDPTGVGPMILLLGSAMLAIPFAIWVVSIQPDSTLRASWLPVAVGLLTFVPLALAQLRFAQWAGLFLGLALAGLISSVNPWLEARGEGIGGRLALLFTDGLILTGFMLLGLGLTALWGGGPSQQRPNAAEHCSTKELSRVLDANERRGEHLILLVNPNDGAELAYRTSHRVVGAPYHRDADGNMDTYEILTSVDDAISYRLLRERSVDLILLCPGRDRDFFGAQGQAEGSLLSRLLGGKGPEWLQPVDWRGLQPTGFEAFRVGTG